MKSKGAQNVAGDEERYYLARVGAEKAYRAMRWRARHLPEGLRHAGALAEQQPSDHHPDRADYFREVKDFLRASAAVAEEKLKL